MSRLVFPELKAGLVDRGNAAIDSPSRTTRYMVRTALNSNILPDVFGVRYKAPHRAIGHDPVSGYLAVFNATGNSDQAMKIWLGHMLGDKMSNIIRDKQGTARRDLFEACLRVAVTDTKYRKKKIRF